MESRTQKTQWCPSSSSQVFSREFSCEFQVGQNRTNGKADLFISLRMAKCSQEGQRTLAS